MIKFGHVDAVIGQGSSVRAIRTRYSSGMSYRECRTGNVVQGMSYRECRTGNVVQGMSYRECRTGNVVQGMSYRGMSYRECRTGNVVQGMSYRECRTGNVVQGMSYRECRTGNVVQGWQSDLLAVYNPLVFCSASLEASSHRSTENGSSVERCFTFGDLVTVHRSGALA